VHHLPNNKVNIPLKIAKEVRLALDDAIELAEMGKEVELIQVGNAVIALQNSDLEGILCRVVPDAPKMKLVG
jgi:hypothetical protein